MIIQLIANPVNLCLLALRLPKFSANFHECPCQHCEVKRMLTYLCHYFHYRWSAASIIIAPRSEPVLTTSQSQSHRPLLAHRRLRTSWSLSYVKLAWSDLTDTARRSRYAGRTSQSTPERWRVTMLLLLSRGSRKNHRSIRTCYPILQMPSTRKWLAVLIGAAISH